MMGVKVVSRRLGDMRPYPFGRFCKIQSQAASLRLGSNRFGDPISYSVRSAFMGLAAARRAGRKAASNATTIRRMAIAA